jgi:hypothetical protein
MAVGFTAGLTVTEHNWVVSYFAKFMLMNPFIVRPTPVKRVTPASFKDLLNAVAATTDTQVVIVAHGMDDGSGLFLPLVQGKVGFVAHDQLDKLMIISNKKPAVATEKDALLLGLTKKETQDLVDLTIVLRKKKPPVGLIEFRGCYLGKNYLSLKRFRLFFGATKMGAPKIGGFFGLFRNGHGQPIFAKHSKSPGHVGTTYTYPQSFTSPAPAGNCLCCIGVDQFDEPQTGHLVADTQDALNRWTFDKFMPGASVPPGDLPVHFLFDKSPPLPPGVIPGSVTPTPQPYFPLSAKYAAQIQYSS